MIAKKNSRLDLERKRTALFSMGLLAASSFALAAFTYNSSMLVEEQKQAKESTRVNYIVQDKVEEEEVKIETETEVQQDNSQSSDPTIDNQAAVTQDITKTDNTDKTFDPQVGLDNLPYNFGDDVPVFDEYEEEIIEWVDEEAEFIGGYGEMQKFIGNNIVYPEISIGYGEQGRVSVSFVVEKDGSITNIFVEKGVSKSLDREAKRIVRSFPKWKPAEVDARVVRTRVRLPIIFTLAN